MRGLDGQTRGCKGRPVAYSRVKLPLRQAFHPAQVSAIQHSIAKHRAFEIGAAKRRLVQEGAGEFHSLQVDIGQVDAGEVGADEARFLQVGSIG